MNKMPAGYDEWLRQPYMEAYDDEELCPHCGMYPCDDPDEAKAEARGLI